MADWTPGNLLFAGLGRRHSVLGQSASTVRCGGDPPAIRHVDHLAYS